MLPSPKALFFDAFMSHTICRRTMLSIRYCSMLSTAQTHCGGMEEIEIHLSDNVPLTRVVPRVAYTCQTACHVPQRRHDPRTDALGRVLDFAHLDEHSGLEGRDLYVYQADVRLAISKLICVLGC